MATKYIPVMTLQQKMFLEVFIESHPRDWKAALSREWQRGDCTRTAKQIRNIFGPGWLNRVTARQIKDAIVSDNGIPPSEQILKRTG